MKIDPNNSQGVTPAHYGLRAYGAAGAGPIAKIDGRANVHEIDQASKVRAPSGADAQRFPEPAQRLVGGVVPGRVDFSAESARQVNDGTSLPMYRHPADLNAAATGVSVGRRIDVQG